MTDDTDLVKLHTTGMTAEQFFRGASKAQPGVWEWWELPGSGATGSAGRQVVIRAADDSVRAMTYRTVGTRLG